MTDPLKLTAASSDADLIRAVRSGHAAAYGILYERHADAARRLARQFSQAPADVDDVVAETFARVLATIRRGAGPSKAFRPYLLTAVRHVALDHLRDRRRQLPTDYADLPDPGEPYIDPADASLERSLVTRAFAALPERWSAVLWHTEVEQAKPAEVALLLGISRKSVAALRYRAREGLRQAYLQMHLSEATRAECAPIPAMLGGYVRNALSAPDARQVSAHLGRCADCRAAHEELTAISDAMRGVLAPAILGSQGAAYLAHASQAALAHGSYATTGAAGFRTGLRWLGALWHHPVLPVAAGIAVAAIAVPTVALVYPNQTAARAPNKIGPASVSGALPHAASRRSAGPEHPGGLGLSVPPDQSPARKRPPSPSPTGSASFAAHPSPTSSATAVARVAAKLAVSVTVNGLVSLGLVDDVTVSVSDQGTGTTSVLTARLALPAGLSLLGLDSGSAGWSCSGSTCRHGPLAAGSNATVSFRVLVESLVSCGEPVGASAVSGGLSATAESAAKVGCGLL
jgi:RNA polymerase sigma factor (sigma-70 family)